VVPNLQIRTEEIIVSSSNDIKTNNVIYSSLIQRKLNNLATL